MTAVSENALRWQSRRGTLELDLILDKFWRRAGNLPEAELRALSALLALDDEELRRVLKTPAAGGAPKDRLIRRLQNL